MRSGSDRANGLYEKFSHIERRDGQSAFGGKHYGCRYFVLDLDHDQHAIPAILAYAESAEQDGYRLLAKDLRRVVWSSEVAEGRHEGG